MNTFISNILKNINNSDQEKNERLDTEDELRIRQAIAEREPEANLFAAQLFIHIAIAALLVWLVFMFELLHGNLFLIHTSLLGGASVLLLSAFICIKKQGKGFFMRHLMFGALILFIFFVHMMSGYKLELLFAIPILLSIRYYNKRLLRYITGMTILFLCLSSFCNAYLYSLTGIMDLNTVFFAHPVQVEIFNNPFDPIVAAAPDSHKVFWIGSQLTLLPNTLILLVIHFAASYILNWNLKTVISLQNVTKKEAAQKVELSETKARIMLSQIQPHFLYNSLTVITYLCDVDPKLAKNTTVNFATYLRANMDSLSTQEPIPVSKELEHIRIYLDIERLRFQEKINVVFDTPDTGFLIPALTLQYLVHNAVEHGLCKTKDGGLLTITTRKTETHHIVTVEDTGAGFDLEEFDADDPKHLGLRRVRSLLDSMVKGELLIESEVGKGTLATVMIPIHPQLRSGLGEDSGSDLGNDLSFDQDNDADYDPVV